VKANIPQQYKDPQFGEEERPQHKIPLLKVRSNIHSGSCQFCYDDWCEANCDYWSGGTCSCCDSGSHSCDHYI